MHSKEGRLLLGMPMQVGFQFIKTTEFSIMTSNKIMLEKQAMPPLGNSQSFVHSG